MADNNQHALSLELAKHAVHLRTVDPRDDDLDDLAPLTEMIGDARIVGIGENTHHVRQFYLARHRLTRFLVERLGFNAFCLESGLVEGLAVNRWLNGEDAELDALITTGFTNRMGASKEFRDQLRWMRASNGPRAGEPVQFFGIDCVAGPMTGLEPLIAYLEQVDPAVAAFYRVELVPLAEQWQYTAADGYGQAMERYGSIDPVQRDHMTALLADLELLLEDRAVTYVASSSDAAFREARWCARLVRQLEAIFRNWTRSGAQDLYFDPEAATATISRNARDLFMADNLDGVLRDLGPDARVVVAAHNAHVARSPLAMKTDPPSRVPGITMLGQYLAQRHGQSYLPIALTCRTGTLPAGTTFEQSPGARNLGEASADSLDGLLSRYEHPAYLTDLRDWPSDGVLAEAADAVTCMRLSERYAEIDPSAAFDLVLHVDSVEPYRGLAS